MAGADATVPPIKGQMSGTIDPKHDGLVVLIPGDGGDMLPAAPVSVIPMRVGLWVNGSVGRSHGRKGRHEPCTKRDLCPNDRDHLGGLRNSQPYRHDREHISAKNDRN